jgi:hypothetical protein
MLPTAELKAAFKRTGLRQMGWTYERALKNKATRIGLEAIVTAERRALEKKGQPAPVQPGLI